ncbi:MAG: hypothetical protein JST40_11740 [Armatimonadetes bacterium]|nr:hypothetical protein [Armatimonadota bacterium]
MNILKSIFGTRPDPRIVNGPEAGLANHLTWKEAKAMVLDEVSTGIWTAEPQTEECPDVGNLTAPNADFFKTFQFLAGPDDQIHWKYVKDPVAEMPPPWIYIGDSEYALGIAMNQETGETGDLFNPARCSAHLETSAPSIWHYVAHLIIFTKQAVAESS